MSNALAAKVCFLPFQPELATIHAARVATAIPIGWWQERTAFAIGAETFCCLFVLGYGSPMGRVKEKYDRRRAEKRFARVYSPVEGDRCIYCGMPSDGKYDHQPPVYVLHRFADGGLVTKRMIRERFGECRLVPCCTICNMGLGAYHGTDNNDRRAEILDWFVEDERYPEDKVILEIGRRLIEERLQGKRDQKIYAFPGVGRVIYINALAGFIDGDFKSQDDVPDWLQVMQSELAEWLRGAPRRKSQYFLDMANLVSYELRPHARDNPRGQF